MKNTRRITAVITALLVLLLALSACGTAPAAEEEAASSAETAAAEPVTLQVFAAASMTETLDAIIDLYTEEHPEVTIVPTYDSSGTLKTQIQEGAECDLFISAAQKQMNQLDAAKTEEQGNEEGLDFVLSDTRVDLLENKVVLAVPDDNPADIQSFKDLATDKLTLLCIGNEDVPVGAYSEEILTALEILEPLKAANKITYGTNVKEVTTQVKEGTVDAGIIYATDAYSAELTVVDDSGSEYCSPVIYPAAVMKGTANEEAARAFLEYLQSEAAMKIFKEVGFTAP